MPVSGPGAIPTASDIPSGGTQDVSYGGRKHSENHNDLWDELVAFANKLGIGASVAAANTVLRGTGAGASAYGQVQAGDLVPGTTAMVKIGEVAGTGSSGVMEIASIPSTYRSLLIHWVGRSTLAGTTDDARLTFETTPTTANYAHQYMYANNTTFVGAQQAGTLGYIPCGFLPGATSTAGLTSGGRIELPEYANTAVDKNIIAHGAGFATLAGSVYYAFYSVGLWISLPAINRIRLIAGGGNWTAVSRLTLWGLPA
jgi:hypothetical protein